MNKWLLLLFIFVSCSRNEFDQSLATKEVAIDFKGYFSLKSFSDEPFIISGENQKSGYHIKISIRPIAEKSEAKIEVRKNILRLMSQYIFSMAPYPGQVTKAINCGQDFKPRLVKKDEIVFIELYANQRFGLSICKEDGYTYKQLEAFFRDSSGKNLIQVEIYQPKGDTSSASYDLLQKHFRNLKAIDLSEFSNLL